jgi:hypothetical protein
MRRTCSPAGGGPAGRWKTCGGRGTWRRPRPGRRPTCGCTTCGTRSPRHSRTSGCRCSRSARCLATPSFRRPPATRTTTPSAWWRRRRPRRRRGTCCLMKRTPRSNRSLRRRGAVDGRPFFCSPALPKFRLPCVARDHRGNEGAAACLAPVAVVQSSLVSTRMQPFTRNRRKTPRFLPRRWRTVVSLAYLQVTQSRQSLGKSNSMATCGRYKEWRDGKRQAVRDRFDMLQSSCRGLISERREGIHIAGRRGQA